MPYPCLKAACSLPAPFQVTQMAQVKCPAESAESAEPYICHCCDLSGSPPPQAKKSVQSMSSGCHSHRCPTEFYIFLTFCRINYQSECYTHILANFRLFAEKNLPPMLTFGPKKSLIYVERCEKRTYKKGCLWKHHDTILTRMEYYVYLCSRIPRGEGCGTVRGTFACLRGCAEQVDLKN